MFNNYLQKDLNLLLLRGFYFFICWLSDVRIMCKCRGVTS